jgi:hypothetical protein
MKHISLEEATHIMYVNHLPPALVEEGYSILMPRDKAINWLKELRSGKYYQGHTFLHANTATKTVDFSDEFCCLGLEQAVNYGTVEYEADDQLDAIGVHMARALPSIEYLNEKGYRFFDESGSIIDNPYVKALKSTVAELNDAGGYSADHDTYTHNHNFAEMADILEKIILTYGPE